MAGRGSYPKVPPNRKNNRGTKEIGGTFIELQSGDNRILIDVGYPLFLNNKPIDDSVASLGPKALLELGVLPDIKGLYIWDSPEFDAVIISHAHTDHYGLLRFVNPAIPIYLSAGTLKLIEISNLFHLIDQIILEDYLIQAGFVMQQLHTSGHASIDVQTFLLNNSFYIPDYQRDFA